MTTLLSVVVTLMSTRLSGVVSVVVVTVVVVAHDGTSARPPSAAMAG
ncbi:MAG: hypothetical protein JNK45_34240 [Myxococcales bacterium]|nr:hypothetical protein [Myxococcales bacterium]